MSSSSASMSAMVMLTFVMETATPALIFTRPATFALRFMSAERSSTSSSMRPTESWGTFR